MAAGVMDAFRARVSVLVVGLRIRYHVSVRETIVMDPLAKTMMSREGQVDAMVKHVGALLSVYN
jgi:hypothetical protein